LSGHSGTAFFEAVEMRDISLRVKGNFGKVTLLGDESTIDIRNDGVYSAFTLPSLNEYCALLLDE
jgi:hypothetical protein